LEGRVDKSFVPLLPSSQKESSWHERDAYYNTLLRPFADVKNLLAIKYRILEILAGSLSSKLRTARAELQDVEWKQLGLFLGKTARSNLAYQRRSLEEAALGCERRLEEIQEHLSRGDEGVASYETYASNVERIANVCRFWASLDTPEKVLSWVRTVYEEKEIVPLREQIVKAFESYQKELARLDEKIEGERGAFESFYNSLHDCLEALVEAPIVDNSAHSISEIALLLQTLSHRSAVVKTAASPGVENEASVHLITTLDAPARVAADVLSERLKDIVDRTHVKYCRLRFEVEQEIRARMDVDKEDGEDEDSSRSEGVLSGWTDE